MTTKNTALQVLGLDHNNIGDEGAKAIAKALTTNATLQLLGLGSNGIGDDGGRAMAEALSTNATLQSLWLGYISQVLRYQIESLLSAKIGRSVVESWQTNPRWY